ncbi:hypothetical protein FUA23_18190 [Neolewinella aurantiaca]|uniref:DUF4380 domain-containing protein n=1 Tax=Neolewinella aurantiaca TaxID=2602767 RepID=A0A5C7FA26_9BACT|nr:hypothetical protein [Neolewinella aurantiaca]TXF87631.1 hypothetical protein FUA23_18190 [Neolewinella aurantiaca]
MRLTSTTSLFFLLLMVACQKPDDSPAPPYTMTRGRISITVEPALGGRISSLIYNGKEILKTTRDNDNLQWGSTVWTSPQSDWNWPPPAAFDSEPYTLTELSEHRIMMEGPRDSTTSLRMRKRIVLGPDSDIGLTYWVTNEGVSGRNVALWENTRLPYEGTFEFVADTVWTQRDSVEFDFRDSVRIVTLDERHTAEGKLFANMPTGEAVYQNNGLKLTKYTVVKDLYRTPPGEAPLEIYLAPEHKFFEFELVGDYRNIGPGESNNVRLKWKLEESASGD